MVDFIIITFYHYYHLEVRRGKVDDDKKKNSAFQSIVSNTQGFHRTIMSQQYSLRWNNHQPNFISMFTTLLNTQTLVDVTLAAEGKHLQAHKVVLSACSTYFQVFNFFFYLNDNRFLLLLLNILNGHFQWRRVQV